MSSSVNVTFKKDSLVLSKTLGEVSVLLHIKELCGFLLQKTELNNSVLRSKSVLINLFSWKSAIFLLFSKDLR